MDTQEYIASGTLDFYVAGLLSIEEMRDVELKACQYPDIKTELQSLQTLFDKYSMKYAMVPPAGARQDIMKIIESAGGMAFNMEAKRPVTVVREISSAPSSFAKYLAAASVALLIVAAGLAYKYSSEASQYQQQVAQLTAQQSSMQNEITGMKESLSSKEGQLAILSDPATIRVPMKGTANSPQSLAVIYWNKDTRSVYLDIRSLPEAPADKQYQLWFIDPSNKPVSAGLFDTKSGNLIRMTDAPDALAFAVTLEPTGGSINPTMDQMYVIGTVSS